MYRLVYKLIKGYRAWLHPLAIFEKCWKSGRSRAEGGVHLRHVSL